MFSNCQFWASVAPADRVPYLCHCVALCTAWNRPGSCTLPTSLSPACFRLLRSIKVLLWNYYNLKTDLFPQCRWNLWDIHQRRQKVFQTFVLFVWLLRWWKVEQLIGIEAFDRREAVLRANFTTETKVFHNKANVIWTHQVLAKER